VVTAGNVKQVGLSPLILNLLEEIGYDGDREWLLIAFCIGIGRLQERLIAFHIARATSKVTLHHQLEIHVY